MLKVSVVPAAMSLAAQCGLRWLSGLVLLSSLAVFARLSLTVGQDINWDLRNYHYYNAYAFLNGRHDWDHAPASWGTFVNPLLDIPFYLLIQVARPVFVGLIIGRYMV